MGYQEGVAAISCGDTFTVAATISGKILTWGKKSRGRLGRFDENCKTPGEVKVSSDKSFSVISLAASHSSTLIATKSKKTPSSPTDDTNQLKANQKKLSTVTNSAEIES